MPTTPPRQRSTPDSRGSIYVAVLLIALVVTVVGLSGLTLARLQLRSAEMAGDVTAARFYAQSAVEIALHVLNTDPDWRTTYEDDTWTSAQPIGRGSFCWKLVDEGDDDLGDDPRDLVRVYGQGLAGNAVRIYSVLVQQEDPDVSNLLRNPGMEQGTTNWSALDCTVAADPMERHGGLLSLRVSARDDYWAGPYQEVADRIEIGTAYEISFWMKMSSGSAPGRITMWVGSLWPWQSFFGGQWLVGDDVTVNDTEWTRVTAELTPTWSGSLDVAFVKIATSSGSTTFYVDDASMRVAGTVDRVFVVPGTWRWVVY